MAIICAGGANWDVKARSGGPVVAGSSNPGTVVRSAGGVARNVAENLARLELETRLCTAVGDDAAGGELVDLCEEAGIAVHPKVSVTMPTGAYVSIHDPTGELVTAVNAMEVIGELTPAALQAALPPDAWRSAPFVFADCNLPVETLAWLRGFAAKLIVDPVSVAKAEKLAALGLDGIHALVANEAQMGVLRGAPGKPGNVIVTLGPRGATVNGAAIAPLTGAVVDVTGAGDAATAGLMYGLARGYPLLDAARLGQAAAALTAEQAGSVSADLNPESLHSRASLPMPSP